MNSPNRVSLFVTLPGEDKGLKTFIQQFMTKQNIGGVVERVKEENDYSTTVLMEANESSIQAGRILLVATLKQKYPNLQIPPEEEWLLEHSTEPLFGSKVKHTSNPAVSRENSSGEVSKVDVFDEVAPNESASQLGSRSLSFEAFCPFIQENPTQNIQLNPYLAQKSSIHQILLLVEKTVEKTLQKKYQT